MRQDRATIDYGIVPLRTQTKIRNRWLTARLQTILPQVMREEAIDVWLLVAREYNEDPVLMSLLPATMLSARRRTVLVFHAPANGEFRTMAIANAGIGIDSHYQTMWNKTMTAEAEETQEQCLRRVVAECNPSKIGINVSGIVAFGDGLSHHEHGWLVGALGEELAFRCVSAEKVAVGWLERRLPDELDACNGINQIAHGIIAEAFSSRVVHHHRERCCVVDAAEDYRSWACVLVSPNGVYSTARCEPGRHRRKPRHGHQTRRPAALRLRASLPWPGYRHAAERLRSARARD